MSWKVQGLAWIILSTLQLHFAALLPHTATAQSANAAPQKSGERLQEHRATVHGTKRAGEVTLDNFRSLVSRAGDAIQSRLQVGELVCTPMGKDELCVVELRLETVACHIRFRADAGSRKVSTAFLFVAHPRTANGAKSTNLAILYQIATGRLFQIFNPELGEVQLENAASKLAEQGQVDIGKWTYAQGHSGLHLTLLVKASG